MPISMEEFEELKDLLFISEEDIEALRRSGDILLPQRDALIDLWVDFICSAPFLAQYFSTSDGIKQEYLDGVRPRFTQWVDDTCRAEFDETWPAYQQEIGRRHLSGKNDTEGEAAGGTPPLVHWRYMTTLLYPMYSSLRLFLTGDDQEEMDRMHQAWLKALLLQVTLWARSYMPRGTW